MSYIDCRSCKHKHPDKTLCLSVAQCVDGNRFEAAFPVQLFRRSQNEKQMKDDLIAATMAANGWAGND